MTDDGEHKVTVPLTFTYGRELQQYMQDSMRTAMRQVARDMWREMTWRQKIRMSWRRLRRVWGP